MVRSDQILSNLQSDKSDLSDAELQLIGTAILDHLQQESQYLDGVIACGMRMSDLLKQSSFNHSPSPNTESSAADSQSLPKNDLEQFNRLRSQLLDQYQPIATGRNKIQVVLTKLESETQNRPSLRELAPHLEPQVRDELNRLRTEIRQKLQDVQAITLGNQAILIYTLDFYHRLLMGITGESQAVRGYNSSGQMTQSSSCHLVEKQC